MGPGRRFTKHVEQTLREVRRRLREKVPFPDTTAITDVVQVLHRLSACDHITHARYESTAGLILSLHPGQYELWQAQELIAQALGHTSYLTMEQEGQVAKLYRNQRKVLNRRHQPEAIHG